MSVAMYVHKYLYMCKQGLASIRGTCKDTDTRGTAMRAHTHVSVCICMYMYVYMYKYICMYTQ